MQILPIYHAMICLFTSLYQFGFNRRGGHTEDLLSRVCLPLRVLKPDLRTFYYSTYRNIFCLMRGRYNTNSFRFPVNQAARDICPRRGTVGFLLAT